MPCYRFVTNRKRSVVKALNRIHKIVCPEVGINPGCFPVYMANDCLQHRQINSTFYGVRDESVAAGVWGHSFPPDFLHELYPLSLCVVGINMAALIPIYKKDASFVYGILPDFTVGIQPVFPDWDYAVFSGLRFASADEIIVVAVSQGNLEQFSRTASAGNQD